MDLSSDVIPTDYPTTIEILLNFALVNTIIDNDVLKLKIPGKDDRLWYKYIIETVGPSVSSLNSKIIQLTKTLKFINDIKNEQRDDENIIDFLVKMENKDNTNKLLSFVLGDEVPIIDTILRVAQNLYNTTPELWTYFTPDIREYPIDEMVYTRNLTFERVFIIRNKYIGDKSRSTDCLFMNKSKYLECMQLSNDTNTLYTAQMYGLSTLWSTNGRKPIIYMAPYLNSSNAFPELTDDFKEILTQGMSSTSSKKSIKVLGFTEKKSDVDIDLIINTTRKRISTSSESRDASPQSVTRVDELDDYTLRGKSVKARALIARVKESKVPQSNLGKALGHQTAPRAQIKSKAGILPPKDKGGKEGGAVIDSKPQTNQPLFTSSVGLKTKEPYGSTSLIDLQQPEKSVGLENNKVAQAPPQITSSIETPTEDYTQIYTEGYRNNLIYVLQNNLRIIKGVHEKYDVLLSDNNLNVEQITDDNKFIIATGLLQIKRILMNLNITYELLIELLEKVNADTTIEQSINIKNMFSRIFDEYNTLNNIGLHGIEYYFNTPEEIWDQVDTTVQKGGVPRYLIKYFYCWQNNNNIILNRFKFIVNLQIDQRENYKIFQAQIQKHIEIAENIYKYLTSKSLDNLEEIERKTANITYKNFIDTYKFISFFYIAFCNAIIHEIKVFYDIIIDPSSDLEAAREAERVAREAEREAARKAARKAKKPRDKANSEQLLRAEEKEAGENSRPTELLDNEFNQSDIKEIIPADKDRVKQNIVISYYSIEDIAKFLTGTNKALIAEFEIIYFMGNLSNTRPELMVSYILPQLFEYIAVHISSEINNEQLILSSNTVVKNRVQLELNGLLFVLYLFYPNILADLLIKYKINLLQGESRQELEEESRQAIKDKLQLRQEILPIFINYYEYLYNFIEQILVYTVNDDIDDGYERSVIKSHIVDLIFQVTSQLYERERFEREKVERERLEIEFEIHQAETNRVINEAENAINATTLDKLEFNKVTPIDGGLSFCNTFTGQCILVLGTLGTVGLALSQSGLIPKGGTRKNKISKKIHKTKNNKKSSSKKLTKKQTLIKKLKKSKRNNK